MKTMIGHGQRLCKTLGLIVYSTRTDRVDIAGIILALWMDQRVTINFAGGGEQEFCVVCPGNAQTVMIITDSSGSFAFSPATLTIKAGTAVTWKNTTTASHTVTSDDGKSFDSGTSNPITAQTGTFSFNFTTAGTFAYHCAIHPFMKATIIVQ